MFDIFATYSELDFKCFEDSSYRSILLLPPMIIAIKCLVSLSLSILLSLPCCSLAFSLIAPALDMLIMRGVGLRA